MAQKAFELDTLRLAAQDREPATPEALAQLGALAERRLSGEPVARMLGEKEFYGLPLILGDATLVPRPETELLVDRGLALLATTPNARILDLGTGTGAIAIALLASLPDAQAVAVDLSFPAIDTARKNAERHGVGGRVEFRTGSWFEPLQVGERFDLIVCNPPYIETAEIAELSREVRDHDPILALDGGVDGLDAYRIIATRAIEYLNETGSIAVEIGSRQAESVIELFQNAGFSQVRTEKDLAGLDRVVLAHHP